MLGVSDVVGAVELFAVLPGKSTRADVDRGGWRALVIAVEIPDTRGTGQLPDLRCRGGQADGTLCCPRWSRVPPAAGSVAAPACWPARSGRRRVVVGTPLGLFGRVDVIEDLLGDDLPEIGGVFAHGISGGIQSLQDDGVILDVVIQCFAGVLADIFKRIGIRADGGAGGLELFSVSGARFVGHGGEFCLAGVNGASCKVSAGAVRVPGELSVVMALYVIGHTRLCAAPGGSRRRVAQRSSRTYAWKVGTLRPIEKPRVMSILPGGSLARSLWTAPSLKRSRRRVYIPVVIGSDALAVYGIARGVKAEMPRFDVEAIPYQMVGADVVIALLVHALAYVLLSIGRHGSFRIARDRGQVEAGEITIDVAAERFSEWPQRRLYNSKKKPATISAAGFAVIGAAFLTGPRFRLKQLGAAGYQWVDPAESMRADGQMRAVINPRSKDEWILPFPSLGDHAIPEGYIGRSVAMLEAAEAMRRFKAERQAARNTLAAGASSFREAPVPDYRYSPYTGKVPEPVLDLLSDMVAVRSEVSAMHILWSSRIGEAPQLTALVEAHHDRTSVTSDITRALAGVTGGDRLQVRLMNPQETLTVRELRTVAVA